LSALADGALDGAVTPEALRDGPEPDPERWGRALLALWEDSHGDWDKAHASAQEDGSADGAWVHAYLHRKEGDVVNASYWYRRAGRPVASGEPDSEWSAIAQALLGKRPES
jgi:hypothetical protein